MSDTFPLVPLGRVLKRSTEATQISADARYRRVTVRLWGQGVVQRDEVSGAEVHTTRQYIVRPQQFLVSRIDARNGAFGIVPEMLNGAIVTNDFPVFQPDIQLILPAFLGWLSKTRNFVRLAAAASEGTTNRVRLSESRFLDTQIPLPPLEEQRRFVARIEELATKIEEARSLRREVIEETESVLAAAENEIWPTNTIEDAPSLLEVTTYLSRGRQSLQGDSTHHLVKTQHVQMGHYVPSRITLAPDAAAKVTPESTLRPGDVLIACSAAGCLGRVANYTDSERTASTDTHVAIARARTSLITPEYLYTYLRGSQGQFQLRSRERGNWQRHKTGFRLTELNLADLRRVPVPLPPVTEQQRIVAYLDDLQAKVDSVKNLQAGTAAELDALLPSVLDKAFQGEL